MRMIDADKFKEDLLKLWDYSSVDGITATTVLKQVISDLDNAPTVSLQDIYQEGHYDGYLEGYTKAINEERPQGEWIYTPNIIGLSEYEGITCSICGNDSVGDFNYCPNCGALMRGGAR